MSKYDSLYAEGVDFIKGMHKVLDEIEDPKNIPDDVQRYFDQRSHYTELMHGSLCKDNSHGSCEFCLLQNITDKKTGKFSDAGVDAMARLLAYEHNEKVRLRAQLEHLRWLFSHVQDAMK